MVSTTLDDAIAPADVLAALDETRVLDDQMNLVPTSVALRALKVQDLSERFAGLKPQGFAPHPLAAQIEFTQRCNLACDFCYNSSGPTNPDELSLERLARLCDELIEANVLELVISGGEPLVRPRHVELILERFKGTDIPIHLLTNGVLLSHRRLEWLKQYNLVTLQVSLDGGDPGVHDAHRGMKDAWAKAAAGVQRASEHGFHTIVSCTLTRNNADSIGDLIDYCYVLGVREVNVGDLITWGRAGEWMEHGACTNEQLDAAAETVQAKFAQYRGQMVVRFPVNMLYYICHIRIKGQEGILIRGNGNVIPHCTLSSLVVGNINEESVASIWDRKLKSISTDPRLFDVLRQHEVVRTERLSQLRCFRRMDA